MVSRAHGRGGDSEGRLAIHAQRGDLGIWQRVAATLSSPLTVVDVGARGGIEEQWLQFLPHIAIYRFEPDPEECERLNREVGRSGVTYLPFAVGSTVGEKPFYVTKDPFCSSLFRPVEQLVRQRPRLAEMLVKEVTSLHTRTIDDWTAECGLDRLDHLKIDAQGAELAILQGAAKSLETVRSIKLEVQFTQLYEDTPLFGQVDSFRREEDLCSGGSVA